jgi:hypothetical protein
MVHGQALRDLGQFEPAAAAFRRALDVWPHAQAANLSLMTLLATHGQRGEAEQVAAAIEAAPVDAIDPWWWFWQGDRRLFSTLLERMRELAK